MNTQTLDQEALSNNVKNTRHWIRLAYMMLYSILLHLAGAVMWMVCVVQFLFVLGTGTDNTNLRILASGLTRFIQQSLLFVSYNSENKPFPFDSWPAHQEEEIAEEGVIIEAEATEETKSRVEPKD